METTVESITGASTRRASSVSSFPFWAANYLIRDQPRGQHTPLRFERNVINRFGPLTFRGSSSRLGRMNVCSLWNVLFTQPLQPGPEPPRLILRFGCISFFTHCSGFSSPESQHTNYPKPRLWAGHACVLRTCDQRPEGGKLMRSNSTECEMFQMCETLEKPFLTTAKRSPDLSLCLCRLFSMEYQTLLCYLTL